MAAHQRPSESVKGNEKGSHKCWSYFARRRAIRTQPRADLRRGMTVRPVRPFVGKGRPAFVVPPGPPDLQIPGGETLPLEADALDEGKGGRIGGLDVGLSAMQRQISEGVPEEEQEPLRHVTKSGVGNERIEAEVG